MPGRGRGGVPRLYDLLEQEVVPSTTIGERRLPRGCSSMKSSMEGLTARLRQNRMVREYRESYYLPAFTPGTPLTERLKAAGPCRAGQFRSARPGRACRSWRWWARATQSARSEPTFPVRALVQLTGSTRATCRWKSTTVARPLRLPAGAQAAAHALRELRQPRLGFVETSLRAAASTGSRAGATSSPELVDPWEMGL